MQRGEQPLLGVPVPPPVGDVLGMQEAAHVEKRRGEGHLDTEQDAPLSSLPLVTSPEDR